VPGECHFSDVYETSCGAPGQTVRSGRGESMDGLGRHLSLTDPYILTGERSWMV